MDIHTKDDVVFLGSDNDEDDEEFRRFEHEQIRKGVSSKISAKTAIDALASSSSKSQVGFIRRKIFSYALLFSSKLTCWIFISPLSIMTGKGGGITISPRSIVGLEIRILTSARMAHRFFEPYSRIDRSGSIHSFVWLLARSIDYETTRRVAGWIQTHGSCDHTGITTSWTATCDFPADSSSIAWIVRVANELDSDVLQYQSLF